MGPDRVNRGTFYFTSWARNSDRWAEPSRGLPCPVSCFETDNNPAGPWGAHTVLRASLSPVGFRVLGRQAEEASHSPGPDRGVRAKIILSPYVTRSIKAAWTTRSNYHHEIVILRYVNYWFSEARAMCLASPTHSARPASTIASAVGRLR